VVLSAAQLAVAARWVEGWWEAGGSGEDLWAVAGSAVDE
jgi:hypothetical protein